MEPRLENIHQDKTACAKSFSQLITNPPNWQIIRIFESSPKIAIRVRWNRSVVLIFISLMVKDVKIFSCKNRPFVLFENCLVNSFAHLLIRLFVYLVFNILSSLYILFLNPLSNEQLAKIFLSFRDYLIILVIVFFDVQSFLI
jgi:hypothetical protein